MEDIGDIKKLKSINVDEDRIFHKIVDVMNSCFGKTWGGYHFLGIFQIDLERSTNDHREYIQISDRANLCRYADEGEFELPEPDVVKVNETEDDEWVKEIGHSSMIGQTVIFEYTGMPRKKKEPLDKGGVRIFPRDKQTAVNALAHAGFTCEIDSQHLSFIRKHSDKPYTEPHHLVPLAMQDQFDVSLDVEENIISLCSNCHNEIHYGKDADRLIRELYVKRKAHLARVGIAVSEKDLLLMYGYPDDSE